MVSDEKVIAELEAEDEDVVLFKNVSTYHKLLSHIYIFYVHIITIICLTEIKKRIEDINYFYL